MALNLDHTAPDERVERLGRYLDARMQKFRGRRITPALLDEVTSFLAAFGKEARFYTKDFPALVMVVIPRLGCLKLCRRDLDQKAIVQTVLNLTVEFPTVTPQELAEAAAAAWGVKKLDIRPGDVKPKRSELVL